jgi:ElaB/YqjD/DUF883 family membrane-anchored ribosome-binding protein
MSEASTAKSKANGGKHDLDAIRDDLDALKSDLGALLKHVKGGTVDGVTDEAKRLYGQLASQGEQSIETLTRRVEEKPLASVLISFGVGFILSRILSR